ncbi:MAG: sugar phosphate isomerase/epimerase [Clostridia bacterium]|nr:sugar phosphate isomerase/epimerase [Clostridia bacterium]
MKIATTTYDFGFYCNNDLDRIRELHRAGFRYIDLNMEFKPDSPYMSDDWRDEVKKVKDLAKELGMTFVQAHSLGGNPLSEDAGHVNFLIDATLRSIEICRELGIKNTVVHSGTRRGMEKDEFFELNRLFYKKLVPSMEENGVNVLIENSTKFNMPERYFVNTGKDMREFIEYFAHPMLHACWDTGHGNCEGDQYDEIVALGDELYAIHYNDNRGKADEHMMPYLGTLNHDEIMNALIDIGYKGYFTLECCSSLLKKKGWPKSRRAFERDDRLAEPQLFMQRKLEETMYEIAEYILKSYDCFEE